MAKRRVKLSEQVRRAVKGAGVSRYRICKSIGLSAPTMSRFMTGRGLLSMEFLDKLADYLGLDVVVTKDR